MEWLTNQTTAKKIANLIAHGEKGAIAVAFWGKGAVERLGLKDWKGKETLKVVCNLSSGAVNPSEIKEILGHPKIEVRTLDYLHAKVYWTDKGCVFGSSNASANGLSLEGSELTAWLEANCLVTDKKLLQDIQKWFEGEVWSNAIAIDAKMLRNAEKLWKTHRKNRPYTGQSLSASRPSPSFMEQALSDVDSIRERNVYIAIYPDDDPTKKAEEAFKKAIKERHSSENGYSFYEDCKFSKPGMRILDFPYSRKTGRVSFEGLYEVPEGAVIKIKKGHHITLLREVQTIDGLPFTKKDGKALTAKVQRKLGNKWKDKKELLPSPKLEDIL